jgi:serine/threonine protein kinase
MIGLVVDGKYRVIDAIGEGGMSSIYEAEHLGLDRRVALKVLHASLADDREAVARLRQEAQVVAAVGHPNICEVFDMGKMDNGSHYLVMERLHGESLADRLKGDGAMTFLELAPLVRQVLSALEAAHSKGILHRDLKPENIFIEEHRASGTVRGKLLDFGISKSMTYDFIENQRLTHTGMVMGTPYYMAPEQARGDSGLDQRVDLWAVGVIMYEALTGRRPFVATNYNALLVKILTSKPRPVKKLKPSVLDAAAAIVEKALSKLREDRFQNAREFSKELARVEREAMVEDPHAPTMMMRRKSVAGTPKMAATSHRNWREAIDDPSTFIDDEAPAPRHTQPDEPPRAASHAASPQGHHPSQPPPHAPPPHAPAPRATVPDRPHQEPRAAAPQAAANSWDAWEAQPVVPTLADRSHDHEDWEQSVPYEPDQRLRLDQAPMEDGHDTEVMNRQELLEQAEQAAAPRARPGADARRVPSRLGTQFGEEGTEIIMREDLERAALISNLSKVPVDPTDPDGGPTIPTGPPVPEPGQARGPEPAPAPVVGGVRRRHEPKPSATTKGKPQSRPPGPPRVPRPRFAHDDEEKTTLFNVGTARAKLHQRQPQPPDDDTPGGSSTNGDR